MRSGRNYRTVKAGTTVEKNRAKTIPRGEAHALRCTILLTLPRSSRVMTPMYEKTGRIALQHRSDSTFLLMMDDRDMPSRLTFEAVR